MRVVGEECVESGEGLGRTVLATESTDPTDGHLWSPNRGALRDRGSGCWTSASYSDLSSLCSDQLLQPVLCLKEKKGKSHLKLRLRA